MYTAYLGLGSNEGDRLDHLAQAIAAIEALADISAVSSVYETEPVDLLDDGGTFLNCAVEIRTADDPPLLLAHLRKVEKKLGKRPRSHRESRPIDIDILLYRGLEYEDHTVHVPHPMLEYRRFVLEPLHEIAPTAVHPSLQKTIASLLRTCRDRHHVQRIEACVYVPPSS
jgi:GTP cyclohydrolase-4